MFRAKRLIAAIATVASVGGLVGGLAAPAGAQEAEGDASGLYATLNGLVQAVIPPLPFVSQPPGGSTSILGVPLNPILGAGVLNAASNLVGATGVASSASVLTSTVLGGLVTADAISSECEADSEGSSGDADVANLQALGIVVPVGVAPNTNIPLPLVGNLALNEQEQDASGIRVRSVHLGVDLANLGLVVADVVIAESACYGGTAARTTAATATSGTPNLTG